MQNVKEKGFYIYCGVKSATPFERQSSDDHDTIVLSDFMRAFCDSRLSVEEVEQQFRRFVRQLDYLKKRAVVVGILGDEKIPVNRRHLLMELMGMARKVITPPCKAEDPQGLRLAKEKSGRLYRKTVQSLKSIGSRRPTRHFQWNLHPRFA